MVKLNGTYHIKMYPNIFVAIVTSIDIDIMSDQMCEFAADDLKYNQQYCFNPLIRLVCLLLFQVGNFNGIDWQ